ncbi:hypothetical protein [Acaryochloris sp. IP29b_bin.137]|uniref:hypothetical protein n=1 Tax=Acaryochloris sp. IP29b_bin.137 TaxID=2969217 RepID=UPI00260C7241|nr:hypothetical protein [Acaryochloris sp. IP29b_bin.137]
MFSPTHFPPPSQPLLLKPQQLELLISLAILPLLVGLLAQQQLSQCVLTFGGWFESIFHGIALPFVEISD